jgi:hypothetical protein
MELDRILFSGKKWRNVDLPTMRMRNESSSFSATTIHVLFFLLSSSKTYYHDDTDIYKHIMYDR